MPYEWTTHETGRMLHLWPYRSLLRRHFVTFMGATALLVAVPLLSVIGSPVLWGVLPFILIVMCALWYAIERSYRDGEILEELEITEDCITLSRRDRKGGHMTWDANPYWTSVHLHPKGGPINAPVEAYVTLKGNAREVEIGAFLSVEERKTLFEELKQALDKARSPAS